MTSLTPNEQNFILLLRAALSESTEQKKTLAPSVDVEGILRLAYEQKLWHMILAALPQQLLPEGRPCRLELIGHVAAQVSLCSDFLAFLEELELAGFHPLVVKGIVCRTLYPHPELRPSSDEDLYISEEEFEPCCAYLSKHGWTPDKTPFSLYDEIYSFLQDLREKTTPVFHVCCHIRQSTPYVRFLPANILHYMALVKTTY